MVLFTYTILKSDIGSCHMPIASDNNCIYVSGALTPQDSFRLLAALHNTVNVKKYQDFTLDFSSCTKAFSPQMLAVAAVCQSYWKQSIDINLKLPEERKFSRLFVNTNWANLIDFRSYEPSTFRGYTHCAGNEIHERKGVIRMCKWSIKRHTHRSQQIITR